MKSFLLTLTALVCVLGQCMAQQKEDIFHFNADKFDSKFYLGLGKDNKAILDLKDHEQLKHLPNMDSLLEKFLQDMRPFQDSFKDPLTIKRVEYKIDSSGRREIRIWQGLSPIGSSYVVNKGDIAALKMEQDTICVLGTNYRLVLLLNQYTELPGLLDGRIDVKIQELNEGKKDGDWVFNRKDNRVHLKSDQDISADRVWGDIPRPNDQLEINGAASIQNYKNYFVPSFSVGAMAVINNAEWKRHNSRSKYEIGAYWEPSFLFSNASGTMKAYRNDFVTLYLAYGHKDKTVEKRSPWINTLVISYLVGPRGGFYADHTFRVGIDEITIFKNNTRIMPMVYFNDFFKGVSPGIRLTQLF
jgi:hypothetical protein